MSFDPVELVASAFSRAIGAAFPDRAGTDPLISRSKNSAFGDFQSNVAMSLGKALGRPPRDVAGAIVAVFDGGALVEPLTAASIAGPGFINVRLRDEAMGALLERLDTPALGVEAASADERRTIVVDLCGVNLAKQMHVGHLRSMVIGDALARTQERLGHRVIRQNHVGDWGLPIAMVTRRVMDEAAAGRVDLDSITLDELEKLYRGAQAACEGDARGLAAARRWWAHPKAVAELEELAGGAEESLERAKATLVKLQAHDPETFAVWQRIADVTMRACLGVCARLGTAITAEHNAGESSYAGALAPLVAELLASGVAEVSDGAVVIRNEGIDEPTIIRKADGGFLYATTDLAAIRRRVQEFGADRVIYAVDARQGLHFRQVFASAIRAGLATKRGAKGPSSLEHAAFGAILGEDGRPFKTRTGENVKLDALLDEAEREAMRVVAEKNPEQAADERERIARAVSVAAVKYADLSSDRVRDYVFSFGKMLAFEGNTGPYLLYAVVRIRSIFRKAAERFGEAAGMSDERAFRVTTTEEKDLALALLRYPGVVRQVGATLEPHRMCQYLFELAGAFSVFFTNCPVLQAEDAAQRSSRLALCALTERVLTDGLRTLGIETLDRM